MPDRDSITITNKLLKGVVLGYIDSISKLKENEKLITISFRQSQDTVSIDIMNGYPDLSLANFNGFTVLNGYHVFVVGAYPQIQFYKVIKKVEPPEDVIAINKHFEKLKSIPNIREPKIWYLKYREGVLLDYLPKDEMKDLITSLSDSL